MRDEASSCRREVRRLRVSTESSHLEAHWPWLDDAERQQARRYRNEADRARFVIARSSLRQILGSLIGVAGRDLAFCRNEFGKPFLADARFSLHFNTSHSGDWVLHAIDAAAPIGVDVEAVREDLARIDQFEGVLSREELAFLNGVPDSHRARAFATVWVRKEAYVKALGEGLSRPLHDISIVEDAAGLPRLLYDRNAGSSAACWAFTDIELDAHHVACMAYRCDA
ncbi:4'-phosphopantetheinyl transferase family protein [Methylibium sp.]|uniref:4'-phosphopantetheinyl transferase family protein n=1 Tax=Methylibium sp. TaxID=2067992 RepID=UPI003D10BAC4